MIAHATPNHPSNKLFKSADMWIRQNKFNFPKVNSINSLLKKRLKQIFERFWSRVIRESSFKNKLSSMQISYPSEIGDRTILGSKMVKMFEPCLNRPKTARPQISLRPWFYWVGMARFELTTPCTPCKCATGLRYIPIWLFDLAKT